MKLPQSAGLLTLIVCTLACTNHRSPETLESKALPNDTTIRSDSFPGGSLIDPVICQKDAGQSYALYIPPGFTHDSLPVIYFFDPHGSGSIPLTKYKALADAYHFILVGSDNSRNGNDWSVTDNIWTNLFDDTQKRLKIDNRRVYTCGFSGGAKVASFVALNHPIVRGVIAGGAGLPDQTPPGNFGFSFTAITGEGDMNMTDLVNTNSALDQTSTRHRIIYFEGKHEWAPASAMTLAFAGLELDAMRERTIPQDDSFIHACVIGSKASVVKDCTAGQMIKAERECARSIQLLDGLTAETEWFKEKDDSIKKSPLYKKQWQVQNALLSREQEMKALYNQQFEQGDINFWKKTISSLQAKAKSPTQEGAMYERLIAYLSLAFYSYSNQLINNGQNDAAKYFVELYKIDDPSNSEAWYFSAILHARDNNVPAVEKDLETAAACGFNDKQRMLQQPEFENLADKINFTSIEDRMKKVK